MNDPEGPHEVSSDKCGLFGYKKRRNFMKLRNERKLKKFSKDIIAVVLSVAIIGTGSGISLCIKSNS